MTITLNHYLLVSGLLFAIGFAGVLLRRNIITIFMCLELMLNAANLSLVAFSRFNRHDAPDQHSALDELGLRSLSVGDVIEFVDDAKFLLCASFGFEVIDGAQLIKDGKE